MLKMPFFGINTRPEMSVPLIHCIIDDTLSQAMPDLLQFMNLTSVANVSVDASDMDVGPFSVIQPNPTQ